MNAGLEIQNLRKTLNKKPKSMLFARLADELRRSSLGEEERLEEALQVADAGLEANPDFLQGRLVRSRILLEKGDLAGAKMDLEFVAEKDPFCLSAQKLLLETLAKLEESPQTEIYQKILGCLEPEVALNPKVLESLEKAASNTEKTVAIATTRATKATVIAKTEKIEAPAPAAGQKEDVSAALDSILEEDTDLKDSIFKTFDNIFAGQESENKVSESKAPEIKESEIKEPEIKEPENKAPELMPYISSSDSLPEQEEESVPLELIPDIDEILNEQLASKMAAGDLPDLTGDINALLEPTSLASADTLNLDNVPNLDSILSEQLASKIEAENLPDLTGDINALLESTSLASADTLNLDNVLNLDSILSEQLASKIDAEDMPDLTGDLNALLMESSESVATVPDIDSLVNEQLASKIEAEALPDLMGDMTTLLASDPNAPSLDEILSEQLASKLDENELPNLTNDLNALLEPTSLANAPDAASNLNSALSAPLAPLVPMQEPEPEPEPKADAAEPLPNLMDDMTALMESVPSSADEGDMEIELMPYIPPSKAKQESEAGAPNIDALIKEQLAPKVDIEDMPDLMGDMLDLLEPAKETKEDAFTQNPTPTLAELYLNQGLAQKAADVYKELLARDPSNAELQTKLAQAQSQIKA